MNRTAKIALAIALVLIVTGGMLITGELLRGTSLTDLWNNNAFSPGVISTGYGKLDGYTVCGSGEESFSPSEVKRIDLSWISGSVNLETGGTGITLKESCSQPLKEDQKLCWKLEKGTLSIRFCSAMQTKSLDKELVLRVPADWTAESLTVGATSADVELRGLYVDQSLTLVVTSGSLLAVDCRCDSLDAGSTSGSVSLEGCVCRDLKLGSTSGSLEASYCRCDSLDAGSTSGSVMILCEAKSITVGSTSGNICVYDAPAGCDVSCTATSGRISLSLSDTSDGQRIEIGTTSGDVYLDIPGAIDLDYDTASGDMSGRLEQGGSGCPEVRVDTTSGDLILGAFD